MQSCADVYKYTYIGGGRIWEVERCYSPSPKKHVQIQIKVFTSKTCIQIDVLFGVFLFFTSYFRFSLFLSRSVPLWDMENWKNTNKNSLDGSAWTNRLCIEKAGWFISLVGWVIGRLGILIVYIFFFFP